MKIRSLLPLTVILALAGCKKSEPAPAIGSGAASAAPAEESPAGGAAAPPGALGDFEGEIGLSVKSAKERKPIPPITVSVKKSKLRFDVPEGLEAGPKLGKEVHAILNAPEKKLFMVVDEQKMVVTMDLEKIGEQVKGWRPTGTPPSAEPSPPPKVTKTGHIDTVAGYHCEDWDVVSAKGERAKVCVSSESAAWFDLPTIGLPADQAWARELFDGHHLPLRVISYDAAGAEDSHIEVTKLEKKPLADSLFDVPAGYRTIDVGEMMKGFMGGMLTPAMMNGMGQHPPGPTGVGAANPNLPTGMQLPPGVKLPPGMQVPPNMAEMMKQLQEKAKAAGIHPPPQ